MTTNLISCAIFYFYRSKSLLYHEVPTKVIHVSLIVGVVLYVIGIVCYVPVLVTFVEVSVNSIDLPALKVIFPELVKLAA